MLRTHDDVLSGTARLASALPPLATLLTEWRLFLGIGLGAAAVVALVMWIRFRMRGPEASAADELAEAREEAREAHERAAHGLQRLERVVERLGKSAASVAKDLVVARSQLEAGANAERRGDLAGALEGRGKLEECARTVAHAWALLAHERTTPFVRELLMEARGRLAGAPEDASRVRALLETAALFAALGEEARAEETLSEALALAAATDDPTGLLTGLSDFPPTPGREPVFARRAAAAIVAFVVERTEADELDSDLMEIARAQVDAGDVEGAETTAAKIRDPWFAGEARVALAEGRARRDDVEAARRHASALEGEHRSQALKAIAAAQARAGDLGAARTTVEEIELAEARWLALRDVVEEQARAGDAAGAAEAAREIEHVGLRAEALESIAVVRAEAGDGADALAWLEGVEVPAYQDRGLVRVLVQQAKSGDREGALSGAEGVRDPLWRAAALDGISAAQLAAGDRAGARESAEEAVRIAAQAQPAGDPWSQITLVARLHARLGNVEAARRVAGSVAEPEQRAGILRALGGERAAEDDWIGLEELADAHPADFDAGTILIGAAGRVVRLAGAQRL